MPKTAYPITFYIWDTTIWDGQEALHYPNCNLDCPAPLTYCVTGRVANIRDKLQVGRRYHLLLRSRKHKPVLNYVLVTDLYDDAIVGGKLRPGAIHFRVPGPFTPATDLDKILQWD